MNKPFEDGFDIILAGIKRENDSLIRKIYYFSVANAINGKYDSVNDFKASACKISQDNHKTAEDIISDVEQLFDGLL